MGVAIFVILIELVAIILGLAFLVKIKVSWAAKIIITVLLLAAYYGPSVAGIYRQNDLCEHNAGEHVLREVKANNYLIVNEGGNYSEGKGIIAAINDVIDKKFDYVEIKVMPQGNHSFVHRSVLKRMGLSEHIKDGASPGYYKLYLGVQDEGKCISPRGEPGRVASHKRYYELSKRELDENVCFGAIYQSTPSSSYMMHLYEDQHDWVPQKSRGMRIVDMSKNEEIASYNIHTLRPRISLRPLLYRKNLNCPGKSAKSIAMLLLHERLHLKLLNNLR